VLTCALSGDDNLVATELRKQRLARTCLIPRKR